MLLISFVLAILIVVGLTEYNAKNIPQLFFACRIIAALFAGYILGYFLNLPST
jgi:hypothetical protein